MPGISLRAITPDNWVECIDLAVTDAQWAAGYVSPNVLSLAQAYAEPWWTPVAVYVDETMVGFVLYGRWPARAYVEMWGDRPQPGVDYILRMMIDQRYQGQGFGKAAMVAVIERIKAQPNGQAIELDYDRDNIAAARLYTSLGFRPVQEDEGGEILARLDLAPA
jgi:diamine N-acetyltransferase